MKIDKTLSPFSGQVRRIDAHLRARYPTLETNIYELDDKTFLIAFPKEQLDANQIEEEFHNTIRFVTVPVKVSNSMPECYVRELPILSDQEAVACLEGIPLTEMDLMNVLTSQFPLVTFTGIDTPSPGVVTILVNSTLQQEHTDSILDYVESLSIPATVQIDQRASEDTLSFRSNCDPMYLLAPGFRRILPDHLRRDDAFWFANIESISRNMLQVRQFPGLTSDAYRCYFDFTTADSEHINLRQALLLYDEIWCSLPLAEYHQQFLAHQGLSERDLLEMVDAGRIRFVTTQPEERLHIAFLQQVVERNQDAVMGRRTTAALLLSDVVATANDSILRDPQMLSAFRLLSTEAANIIGVPLHDFVQITLWPLASLRNCLPALFRVGSMGSPVNLLAEAIASQIRATTQVDIELEAWILGGTVHIGHALGATVFGPINEPKSHHFIKAYIGRLLNFHRNFSSSNAGSWLQNELRREKNIRILPSIPIFEFHSSTPVREILTDTSLGSIRSKGRSLYSRIVGLEPNERQDEIERLAASMRERARKRSGLVVDLDTMETVSSIVFDIFDVIAPIKLARNVSRKVITKVRRRNRKFDDAMGHIEDSLNFQKNGPELDFLSQIDRVASLRRERI